MKSEKWKVREGEVDDADEDGMETNDDECTYWQIDDGIRFEMIYYFAAIQNSEKESDIDRVEEGYMYEKILLIQVPFKQE